jgi:hypothetical protein
MSFLPDVWYLLTYRTKVDVAGCDADFFAAGV